VKRWRLAGSLRLRLLAATLVTLAIALAGSHVLLSSLFRDQVLRQFDSTLVQQLDQLAARLEADAQGQPRIDPRTLSDPRWEKPYSGLYWQLDRLAGDGQARVGVLRSRSLWDTQLLLDADVLGDGALHTHEHPGPRGETLRVVERALRFDNMPAVRWRLAVAADTGDVAGAVAQFNGVLAVSLVALGVLLVLAALAQVGVGLSPLGNLQRALQQVRAGQAQRLEGEFPAEVQPLVDDFNGVLDRNAEVVARARTQAGNLAHALKTPLAVLDNAASRSAEHELRGLVGEQVHAARRHIDWHLARARAAATQRLPGQRTPLRPVVEQLLRVMGKLYAARQLTLSVDIRPEDCAFAGEEQDLQEMLGNLLDNACRSARSTVRVHAGRAGDVLQVVIEDDGPGIAPEARAAALGRGVRLDESTPGSGLGLAIVQDLAQLYGGALALEECDGGGLRARLELPGSP
jgi:signal transduction histidine kinase